MGIYPHLVERNLSPFLYPNLVVDKENNIATFPLFSFSGKYIGYQQYNPNGDKKTRKDPKSGKYFTYSSEPAVWGLESLSIFSSNLVVLCEGIFGACRFHRAGIPAIATLTNNPKHLANQLALLSLTKELVVVPDPDKAGRRLLKYGNLFLIPPKSVDELSDKEFLLLIEQLY